MQALTPTGEQEYKTLKAIVCKNWDATMECAAACLKIKNYKLYRYEFETWKEFCDSTLGCTPQYVNRLITAKAVVDTLKAPETQAGEIESETIGSLLKQNVETDDKSLPISNEAQARALAKVPPEKRPSVLAKAAQNGPVTAESIAAAAQDAFKVIPPPSPSPRPLTIELDETGFQIPQKGLSLWERRQEVQKLLTAVSTLRSTLRHAQEDDDPLWRPVVHRSRGESWSRLIGGLDQAYASVAAAMPYAVCPVCQGQVAERCTTCQERGFVSEFFYNNCLDSNLRTIRETACQKKA